MRKTVIVSDMSGKEIEEGKGAILTLKFADRRKNDVVAELTDQEADALKASSNGRTVQRRGRKPGYRAKELAAVGGGEAEGQGNGSAPEAN